MCLLECIEILSLVGFLLLKVNVYTIMCLEEMTPFLLKSRCLAKNLLLNKTILLNGQWKVTTRTTFKAPFVCDKVQN